MARHYETNNGFDVDFTVSASFDLDWVGFNDDMEPGVYLRYKFYTVGKDHAYLGYMPVDLQHLRNLIDE